MDIPINIFVIFQAVSYLLIFIVTTNCRTINFMVPQCKDKPIGS